MGETILGTLGVVSCTSSSLQHILSGAALATFELTKAVPRLSCPNSACWLQEGYDVQQLSDRLKSRKNGAELSPFLAWNSWHTGQ